MIEHPLHVVGLGELLWDDFPSGRQIGGAPANFAYHCQVLGAQAHVVSAVGDDAPGTALLAGLRQHHLDTAYVHIDTIHPTGRVPGRSACASSTSICASPSSTPP
jgi:fructokinase